MKLMIFLLFATTISYAIDENNYLIIQKYYRVAIVVVDKLKLDNGEILRNGDLVQLVSNKNTEEGSFIRTKVDSALVYSKDILPICWLKENVIIENKNTKTILSISDWYVFKSVQGSYCYIMKDSISYKVILKNIYFDNEKFYNSLTK